ncbi:cysteine-rich CWC family protein [Aliivibrio fischeri]|uniref:cysteine-rich CWC family protein n=1 Tax=Aliivibrio fischeri TaxID=668 RepID=UPI0037370E87
MKSPCRAACKNEGGICIGCKRTMKEVLEWRDLGDEGRGNIMGILNGEIKTHLCPECGESAQCDIKMGKDTCWCFELESRSVNLISDTSECLCRHCLSKKPVSMI